jgi:hypothetical protein
MSTPSFVYFIRPIGMLAPVKIGCSTHPQLRLESLVTWSPFPLEIAASTPGNFKLERVFHQRFAHVRSHREWFLADKDLLCGIEKLRAGKSVDEAFDLSIKTVSLSPRHHGERAGNFLQRSYRVRVRNAVKRVEKERGGRWLAPDSIDRMFRSRITDPLTSEQIELLETFLECPADHVVALEVKYPRWVGKQEAVV